MASTNLKPLICSFRDPVTLIFIVTGTLSFPSFGIIGNIIDRHFPINISSLERAGSQTNYAPSTEILFSMYWHVLTCVTL